MRLIDADELKEGIACHKQWTDQEYETDRQWALGYNAGIERALFSIRYAHTIEAELVRHGRWVRKEKNHVYWHECSECGERPLKSNGYYMQSSFCPFCGANMDAKEEPVCD